MLIIFYHIKAIVPTYGNKPIVTLPKWAHYEYSVIRLGGGQKHPKTSCPDNWFKGRKR
jgi:hypothetical protein